MNEVRVKELEALLAAYLRLSARHRAAILEIAVEFARREEADPERYSPPPFEV